MSKLKIALQEIINIVENTPCGYYDIDEFDENDECPEDAVIHDISRIRKIAMEVLNAEN